MYFFLAYHSNPIPPSDRNDFSYSTITNLPGPAMRKNNIMTIGKYEQTLTEHSRHIIESDEIMKPLLDKIEDLDRDYSINE